MKGLSELKGRISGILFPLELLLCAAQAALLALYNVNGGPLRNLNDIGGWRNRAVFIVLAAAVHFLLLAFVTVQAKLHRRNFARTCLRQMIMTFGVILLLGCINQKSYAYVHVLQPMIRAMDEGGLAAGMAQGSGYSAPMITLLYLLTRGPVYDMYMVKLMSIFFWLLLCLEGLELADRRTSSIRAETVFALCVILPQGYIAEACSAQPEILCGTLLGAGLLLIFGKKDSLKLPGWILMGSAAAFSGLALYAVPFVFAFSGEKEKRRKALTAAAVMLLFCILPAAMGCGVPETLRSLLNANLNTPAYASGAPGILTLIPRANVEEMEGWFLLRRLPELDLVTNAQEFYTQAHFEQACHGFAVMALGLLMVVWNWLCRSKDKSPLRLTMTAVLTALMICPHTTAAGWLPVSVLCILALVFEPELRLPACLILFTSAGAAAWPLTEETLLPCAAAALLMIAALLLLLGIIPTNGLGEAQKDV